MGEAKVHAEVQDLLRADRLDDAITLMNGEVKRHVTDVGRRATLAELLCLAGNLERADTILASIDGLDPSTGVGVAMFRQLVRAEQARRQFHFEGRAPEFLRPPDLVTRLELRAAVLMREQASEAVAPLIEQRDAARPAAPGRADGVAFDDFRDLDDLCGGHLEILTSNGKYYWAPIASVVSLEFRKPERRRDLLWPRLHLTIADGPDGEVFMPAIYASSQNTVAHKLGHATDFVGDGPPVIGLGLRGFLVGEEMRSIRDLGRIEFIHTPAEA
jgi:type VI secretion system protein ImpE